MTLDPHFAAMLEAQAKEAAGREAPPLDAIPPAMVRAGYRMQRQAQDQNAPRDVETRDLRIPADGREIPARLYASPAAGSPAPGLVYFHGGGFTIGDLETHDGHCRRLAALAGVRVLSVDYRLAPEHPFPAGHDDALDAVKWAFDNAPQLGMDSTRMAVGGDSAGGNLAASVAIDLKDDPARRLKFQLLLYPGIWPETETQSRKDLDGPVLSKAAIAWFDKCLAAAGHDQAHRAHLGKAGMAFEGLPPALVVTAGFDPLKDEGRDYAEKLRAAGVDARHVEYASLVHDFYIMPDVSPAAMKAAEETAAALKAALG